MEIKDCLGNRMKEYENVSRHYLTRRMPALVRLDGKAFHTFTGGMQRPFDPAMTLCMQETARYLCKHVQGCKTAYVQSDEISLLLTDYETHTTDAWFDNNIQKIASVSASMATMVFNRTFRAYVDERYGLPADIKQMDDEIANKLTSLFNFYSCKIDQAMFDSRVFLLPKEEVCNYFIWRQQDAVRNSIQSVGQANFSQKQLHGKNCNEIQEMLFQEKGINWNDLPATQKRGACIIKTSGMVTRSIAGQSRETKVVTYERTQWTVDERTPTFTEDRGYIEKLL
jgi:tRNA(His) guanylyltransferase